VQAIKDIFNQKIKCCNSFQKAILQIPHVRIKTSYIRLVHKSAGARELVVMLKIVKVEPLVNN